MEINNKSDIQYTRYKEFIKQKRLEYFDKNKEEIK